jgi:hypothetical protein
MKRICTLFILTATTFIFAQKPDRFSHDDMRLIMERNSLQLEGMKIRQRGSLSARFGFDSLMTPKAGIGYRNNIDWTYPLAVDVGANIFYDSISKKQVVGGSLESTLLVLLNTADNLPLYFGAGVEMKSNALVPLLHPKSVRVPKFMYKIPMPEPTIVFGKTLLNDSFIQARYTHGLGPKAKSGIGVNYGFGF